MPLGISQTLNINSLNHSVRSEIERSLIERWRDLLLVVTEDSQDFSFR